MSSPVRDFRELAPRMCGMDPLLLLATLGLIAAGVYRCTGRRSTT